VHTFWCYNIYAISLSTNSIFHACTQYVKVHYYFVHDKIAKKDIQIHFISSKDQQGVFVFEVAFACGCDLKKVSLEKNTFSCS
jgi:hypothetical protein